MTATLTQQTLRQATPWPAPKPKKPTLVKNLRLRINRDALIPTLWIGTKTIEGKVRGEGLVKFLDSTLGHGYNRATVTALPKLPSYAARQKWRGGWTMLMAIGAPSGAVIAVYGTIHAVGYADFCGTWKRKLGLTNGKIRYFRVRAVAG